MSYKIIFTIELYEKCYYIYIKCVQIKIIILTITLLCYYVTYPLTCAAGNIVAQQHVYIHLSCR